MKSLIKITLCVPLVVLALFFALCVALVPAGASSYKTNINAKGILEATKPFQSFGNFNLGDCQYETAANLILARWPKAKITTAEVVSAYNTYGDAWQGTSVTSDGGATWTNIGLWAGQNYLLNHGFAGHRATSISQPLTNKYQIVQAANHGGLEVTIEGPTMMHVLGVIQATAKNLTVVDDGFIRHYTWAQFTFAYTNVVTAQGTYASNGEVLAFYAVVWS